MQFKGPGLEQRQWNLLAGSLANVSQGVILFSLGAFFIPQVVGLTEDFPVERALNFFLGGLILLAAAVKIMKRGR